MNITLRQLTYLREIARSSSFTEAARRLHTSQSNLSTAVRLLEDTLGVLLINRSTKHFELTSAGKSFLAVTERVLNDLDAALENTSAISRLERGTLSIGAPTLVAATYLPEIIGQFHRKYPSLELRLHEVPSRELDHMLHSREIELAIGTFRNRGNLLVTQPLFHDDLVVIAHHELDLPNPCTWQDLTKVPMVSIAKATSVGKLIEETAHLTIHDRYEPILEVESWSAVVAFTASLRAASIVPSKATQLVQLQNKKHALRVLELQTPSTSRAISLAYVAAHDLTPTAQAFIQHAFQSIGQNATLRTTRIKSVPTKVQQ